MVRKSSTGGANVLSSTVSDLTFKDLVGIFGRQKWLIILITLLFLVVGAGLTFLIPPQYTANVRVLIQGRTLSNPGTGGSVEEAIASTGDSYDVPTQIQLLESQDVLLQVLERTGVQIAMGDLGMERGPKIEVRQLEDTNVVQAQVAASSADTAKRMAETLPDVYSEFLTSRSSQQVTSALNFVSKRIEEESAALETARTNLADFQRNNQVLDPMVETSRIADMERVDSQDLKVAEASVREAEAAMSSVRQARSAIPPTVTLPIVRTNREEKITEARELELLEQERESLLVRYLPEHRLVRELDARIKQKKDYIATLETTVTERQTVRNPELDVYDQRVANQEAVLAGARARLDSLRSQKTQTATKNNADLSKQVQALQGTVRSHESTLEELRRTSDALKLRDNALKQPTQKITSQAFPRQTRPSWGANLVLAGLLGLVVGVFVGLSRDIGQDKVLNPRTATAIADTIILARIPRRPANQPQVITNPTQALSFEAYRMLRTNLAFADPSKPVKSVMVTSSVPKEGVSTIAANLAVAFAQEGRKVVLVDANLRSPKVSALFNRKDAQGVVQIIKDRLDVQGFLIETDVPKLTILPAGGQIGNPTEALASELMKNLLASLEESHNIVIIDAPSAYGTADAHQLADIVDGVVYVIDPEVPSKSQMAESIDMLRHSGGKILGLVINKDKSAWTRLV